MAAPTHTSSAGIHVLDWPECHIRIRIDRLRNERENLTGEITVKTTNPGVAQHLHQARFNLTSTTARKTLAKVLEERIALAWDDMIEQACVLVLTKHREGEPVIRVGNLPPREALKYRVAPVLLNNQPTLAYGPGGCVAGDTLVQLPQGNFSIESLAQENQPIEVWALDELGVPTITKATAPFLKGIDDLYTFRTDSGKSITVTGLHRFLTYQGWQRASSLHVGDVLAVSSPDVPHSLEPSIRQDLLVSSDAVVPSMSPLDGQSFLQIDADSIERYGFYRRQYGQRLPLVSENGPTPVPSQADAPEHSHAYHGRDGTADGLEYIHPYQPSDLLAKSNYGLVEPWQEEIESHSEPLRSVQPFENTQGNRLSLARCAAVSTSPESSQSEAVIFSPYVPSTNNIYYDTISSITHQGVMPYYDLHVPHYENYLANGVWNHNTGKSYFALYLAVLIGGAWEHNNLLAEPGKVLVLDYETDQYEVDERIKAIVKGLGVETKPEIYYRFCAGPLSHETEDIQSFVTENQIDVVIVDPLGGAVGADMNDSEPILDYFRALRAIRTITGLSVTSLSIDHTNKEGRLFGCHSSDTEVLTKDGWMLHSQLQPEHMVAVFNSATNRLSWEKPQYIHQYDYQGLMYRIKTNGIDLLVTPQHRLVVQNSYTKTWQYRTAETLGGYDWQVPLSGLFQEDDNPCSVEDAKVRFTAWYITEGCISLNRVYIGVGKLDQADEIASDALALDFTPYRKTYPGRKPGYLPQHRLVVKAPDWLQECGATSAVKRLPAWTWTLPKRQQQLMFETLWKGDGSWQKGGRHSGSFTTSSKQLADDVQRLALSLGMTANVRQYGPRHYSTRVKLSSPTAMFRAARSVHPEHYDGKVYCLTVSTGAYLVRRNGITSISGNSEYKFHRARSVFEAKKQQDTGADFLDFGLYHRKMNNGKLLPPRGYHLAFGVDSVVFTEKDVRDVPELAGGLNLKDQLIALLRHGAATVQSLAPETLVQGKPATAGSVKTTLYANKGTFRYLQGGRWGLIGNVEDGNLQ